jgi:hypothetical protein
MTAAERERNASHFDSRSPAGRRHAPLIRSHRLRANGADLSRHPGRMILQCVGQRPQQEQHDR